MVSSGEPDFHCFWFWAVRNLLGLRHKPDLCPLPVTGQRGARLLHPEVQEHHSSGGRAEAGNQVHLSGSGTNLSRLRPLQPERGNPDGESRFVGPHQPRRRSLQTLRRSESVLLCFQLQSATAPSASSGSAWRCCPASWPPWPSSSAGNGKATLSHTTPRCCVWNTFLRSFCVSVCVAPRSSPKARCEMSDVKTAQRKQKRISLKSRLRSRNVT